MCTGAAQAGNLKKELPGKTTSDKYSQADQVILQLAWLNQFQFAGYYAAVEKGFYRDAGLKVTILEGSPKRRPVQEVVSGRAHYGVAKSEILLHRMHGKPVLVLAAIFQHSAIILLAKEESGISTPQDMIGRRVMLLKGNDSAEYIAMFRNEGVSMEQINVIPSTYNINDLIDGKTDVFNAYATNEPYYLGLRGIRGTVISPITYGIDFYGDCLFTSEQELREHPERVRAFRKASLLGWEYAMAHTEEIIDVILDKYGVNKTRDHLQFEAKAMGKLILPRLIEMGHMNPGRWRHVADTYVELGMAEPGYSLENFIYDPNPAPDYTRMRQTLVAVFFLILLIGASAIILFVFNRRLRVAVGQRTVELEKTNQSLHKEISERRKAEKELERYHSHLEELVKERTEALSATNLELRRAKESAEVASRAKSEFLSNMSHELRTPLNAVTGFSELLSSLVSDQKQKSYLNAIKTAGKSLLTLINDILDLSKIEAGMMEIRPMPVNPIMIFNEIEQIFKMKIIDKNLQFITDIDKDLPALMLDETRFRQILLNLVGNAIKFTEKGHIKLTAKKTYKTDDQGRADLIISVEDTGIGVPKQEQENIFEPFRQQDGQITSKYSGTGLGLSISKRLVEIMNGRITVDSSADAGSTFEIILRDVDVSLSEVPLAEERTFDIENISFETAKILVTDDVESNREMLSELLSRVNLDVLTAENGQEAVLMAREYQPDIILMDIRMPVMDGIEATKRLKNNPKTRDIPIIAVTASSTAHDRSEILAEGLDGYLTKPVKLNALFDELSHYLDYTEKSRHVHERDNQLACDDIERLPELVSTLRNEILPCLHDLQGAMIMGDIKEFGNRLQSLGKEHRVRELVRCGEELNEFARNFDITNIDSRFKELSETAEQLANMI